MANYVTVYSVFQCEVGREARLAEAATEDRDVTDTALLAHLDNFVRVLDGEIIDTIPRNVLSALHWLQKRVVAANAETRAYIAMRYKSVAEGDLPRVVIEAAMSIALYRIYGGDADSEEYRRFQSALKFLRDVAAGHIDLDVPTAANNRPVARVTGGQREFDAAAWAGY